MWLKFESTIKLGHEAVYFIFHFEHEKWKYVEDYTFPGKW